MDAVGFDPLVGFVNEFVELIKTTLPAPFPFVQFMFADDTPGVPVVKAEV